MSEEKSSLVLVIVSFFLIVSSTGMVYLVSGNDGPPPLQQIESDTDLLDETPYVKEDTNYTAVIDNKGTGLVPPSIEDFNWELENLQEGKRGIYTVGTPDYLTDMINEMDGDISLLNNDLPVYVDHTQSEHFPPIAAQGQQGACTAFSFSYYLSTFLFAQEYNYTVNTFGQEFASTSNSPVHADKIMSPAWTYNHVNNGEDTGSNWIKNYRLVNAVGNSNWENMPYDENDHISWGTETAYRNAPQYRVTGYEYLHMDDQDYNSILTILKTWLHEGYLISFGIDSNTISPWRGDTVISSEELMENESNHAQTVIGYDDDIIDTDGSEEIGAFLVANSWGNWGPYRGDDYAGTYWITYEAFINHLVRRYVHRLTGNGLYSGSAENSPELLGTMRFTSRGDRDPEVNIGIAHDENGTVLEELVPGWSVSSENRVRYPKFMAFDLTDYMDIWDHGNGANQFFLYMGESEGISSIIEAWQVEYYEKDYVWNNQGNYATKISLIPKNAPGANPITMWTSFTSTIGKISFDSGEYAEFDTIGITVEDEYLIEKQNVYIEVCSSIDSMIVELKQNKRYMHIWEGSIHSSRENGEEVLQVRWGDTITVTYFDVTHNQKRTDSAIINQRTKTDTIRIQNNAGFNKGPWTGNGTETDPWTILRLEIDNGESGYGLYIENVTDHFLIRDCLIYNSNEHIKKHDVIVGGIYLLNSTNGRIKNNIFTDNDYGIYSYKSFGNYIAYNRFRNNLYGTYLLNSTHIYVSSNQISENKYGLFSRDSYHNYLGYNNISQNEYGAYLLNTQEKYVEENVILNNEYGIYLKDSTQNEIYENNYQKNDYGVYLSNSDNNKITHNILSSNLHGIFLRYSMYNQVKSNNAVMNYIGIHLSYTKNNDIIENIVYRNRNGFLVDMYSDINIIARNHVFFNSIGLNVQFSNNNIIVENLIEKNFDDGLLINRSNSNSVVMNTLSNNELRGILIKNSYGNRIYHNNFIENTYQAKCSGDNIWNHGYPFGGNYWSDLTSSVEDRSRSDYIHDAPYMGDGFSDEHPFISSVQNTSYPIINIYLPLKEQEVLTNNVTVNWISYRADYHEVKIDDCNWIVTRELTELTFEYVSDGEHTILVRAWDEDGNSMVEKVKFNVNTTGDGFYMWNHITIIIISTIAIVLITLKRHFRPKYASTRKTIRDKGSF